MVDERLLHRVQPVAFGQALYRRHVASFVHHREGQAGQDASAVQQNGARAAGTLVAAFLGTGQAKPVTVQINTFGTGHIPDHEIAARLLDVIDFRPGAVIKQFNLRALPASRDGFYRKLAVYGHVGRDDIELPWEKNRLNQFIG